MSRILHPVRNLPAPYSLADQRMFDIEPGGHVRVPPSSHYKMVLVREGKMNVSVGSGSTTILATVQPGDVLIVPRLTEYAYHPVRSTRNCRLHVIRILWDPRYISAGADGPVLSALGRAHPGCRRIARQFFALRVVPLFRGGSQHADWMTTLLAECARTRPGRERMIAALLGQMEVFLERGLSKQYCTEDAPTADRAAYLASRTREILAERLEHAWTLDELAWELRVSGGHLSRAFRRSTGTTVFAELSRLRVGRACEWLLTTEWSVGEIARKVGVPDPTIFGRMFRRLEGESPSRFRDRHRAAMIFIPRHGK